MVVGHDISELEITVADGEPGIFILKTPEEHLGVLPLDLIIGVLCQDQADIMPLGGEGEEEPGIDGVDDGRYPRNPRRAEDRLKEMGMGFEALLDAGFYNPGIFEFMQPEEKLVRKGGEIMLPEKPLLSPDDPDGLVKGFEVMDEESAGIGKRVHLTLAYHKALVLEDPYLGEHPGCGYLQLNLDLVPAMGPVLQ